MNKDCDACQRSLDSVRLALTSNTTIKIIIVDRTLSHVIYILFIEFAVAAIAVTLTVKQLTCIGCKLNYNETEAIVEMDKAFPGELMSSTTTTSKQAKQNEKNQSDEISGTTVTSNAILHHSLCVYNYDIQ